jgi:hypothetical protein
MVASWVRGDDGPPAVTEANQWPTNLGSQRNWGAIIGERAAEMLIADHSG